MLVLRRTGVVSVAVALGDFAVPVVDDQLGTLVTADLPAPVDGVLLSVEIRRSTAVATPFDIPPAAPIRDDVVRLPAQVNHPPGEGFFLDNLFRFTLNENGFVKAGSSVKCSQPKAPRLGSLKPFGGQFRRADFIRLGFSCPAFNPLSDFLRRKPAPVSDHPLQNLGGLFTGKDFIIHHFIENP